MMKPVGEIPPATHSKYFASRLSRQSRSRPISGFRTGTLGMGHAVLNVENIESLLPFYRDLLGFKVSDFRLKPYGLYFFHVNGRHHSFAIVGSGRRALHHFMIEVGSLDDVGQGYDLAQLDRGKIAYTLGRHTNDHMTSFYVNTPSASLSNMVGRTRHRSRNLAAA
jgi:catechol 2,3-dioxygenase-like lactoylglutathione lyase family enzyme